MTPALVCFACACLQGFYPGFETRTDVTRISKQGCQWPSNKDKYPRRIFLKKIVKPAVDSSDSPEVYFPTDLSYDPFLVKEPCDFAVFSTKKMTFF